MKTVLGIDVGTQSVKALFYDYAARRIAAVESAPLELVQRADGTAEQAPQWWLDALRLALARVPGEVRRSVSAISVSGQQHGFVALDADARVLRAAKLWCDTSTQREVEEITAACGGRERAIESTGNPVLAGYTAPKIRWLKHHEPALYARLAHVLLPHDYVNHRLTGALAMEHGDASGTGLLDVRTREWSDEMLRAVDAERDLRACLPPLVEAGAVIGTTTPDAADTFGLPVGVPVATGGGDNMMGAVGTGNVEAGRLTMSLGSSGTLYAHADRPIIDPKGEIAAFCGSTGGWLPLLCTMNCTLATELIRAPLGVALDAFDATIEAVPPGADGVIVLPFFNGERTPDLPHARASILGLGARNTTRGHLLRATVEGATFALRFGVDALAALGVAATEIVLTGGGANSRVWRQIVADVTGLPVVVLEQNEGASFGAALHALWTLERQRDAEASIAALASEHLQRAAALGAAPAAGTVERYAAHYAEYRRALDQVVQGRSARSNRTNT